MNTFLLAAGKGTRLQPLTLTIPKCLVCINNKPLLSYWIDLFVKYKIKKIYINSHHFHEQVFSFVSSLRGNYSIEICYEDKLLGSLGTLVVNKSKIIREKEILVCYADNLTNLNIDKFIKFHRSHDFPVSIGLFETDYPKECGILELNEADVVVSFEEKPPEPKSNLANAGIYIFDTDIFKSFLYNGKLLDIAYDLLPKYIGKMKGYKIEDFIYDIGDVNKLAFAENYLVNNPEKF